MRIRHWPQSRIAHWGVVHVPQRGLAELVRVLQAQLHQEVVRVLAVDDGFAVSGLSGLKQQGIVLVAYSCRFEAEHGAQHDVTTAETMQRAEHSPVRGVEFIGTERTRL